MYRRRAERLQLEAPILGHLDDIPVVITTISELGGSVDHHLDLPRGLIGQLRFRWRTGERHVPCRLVQTRHEELTVTGVRLSVYRSGISFLPPTTSREELERLELAETVAEALLEQKANAFGVSKEEARNIAVFSSHEETPSIDLNSLFRFETDQPISCFVCCRLDGHRWSRSIIDVPAQPEDGFTVLPTESEEEIETLCWTYQNSDHAARHLIRTFAHLSVSEAKRM